MNADPKHQTDHDLLVTLNERVANMILQLNSLVASAKTVTDDHETRIRNLEKSAESNAASARTWRFFLTISISLVGAAVGLIALFK